MLGKVPDNIIAKRPLREGVIASYRLTEALLSYFLNKAIGKVRVLKPEVMISVPAGITTVEERAVIEAAVVELVYEGVRKGLWNFKKES